MKKSMRGRVAAPPAAATRIVARRVALGRTSDVVRSDGRAAAPSVAGPWEPAKVDAGRAGARAARTTDAVWAAAGSGAVWVALCRTRGVFTCAVAAAALHDPRDVRRAADDR